MATVPVSNADVQAEPQVSWFPMLVIANAQILLVFNISTLQVSIDGIASSFNTSATTVGTAIVTYSLLVAGFIMLGARIAQRFGARRVFRITVVLFGAAMALMAFSPGVLTMIVAQVAAGAAAAAMVPTLVVMIADHYQGRQQLKALGWLGGAQAMGVVLAFLIAGYLATSVGWRFTFGLLVFVAVTVYKLSDRLIALEGRTDVSIDSVGVSLAASAILLISVGCNSLTDWGVLLAKEAAPFSILDMSPAPLMILCGIFLVQGFVSWSRRREASGRTPLMALEVFDTSGERAALYSLFTIGAISAALTFLIPLYIQVVQGGSGLDTAAVVVPFSLASFAAAVLAVRLYDRMSVRVIARYSFLIAVVALALLGAVIRNDWSTSVVIFSMVVAGLAEGTLAALLFNVLAASSPKELAGDVGSLRGCTNNLAAGVGTALASALVISLLATGVHRDLAHNPLIPDTLKAEFNLDDVPFISNDQLRNVLGNTPATSEQVTEAVRINTETRLVALKISFFALAGLALLAFFPAGGLPEFAHSGQVGSEERRAAPGQAGHQGQPGQEPAGPPAT